MNVLMVGATGPNAGLVLPALTTRGVAVRALVRTASGARIARERGATQVAIGDLRDQQSLRDAAIDVDGVFHIGPAFAPDEAEMGIAMVNAAKDAGVNKFVFSSVLHPSIRSMSNHAAKQPVEEAIYASGMDFTVLQPAMFMQNLAGAADAARRSGQFAMPYSKRAKVCWVDFRDVAEVAALAFTTDELSYGTFELSAPGLVDRVAMAALLSRAMGRPVEAAEVGREPWSAQIAGRPDARRDDTDDGPLRRPRLPRRQRARATCGAASRAAHPRAVLRRGGRPLTRAARGLESTVIDSPAASRTPLRRSCS